MVTVAKLSFVNRKGDTPVVAVVVWGQECPQRISGSILGEEYPQINGR